MATKSNRQAKAAAKKQRRSHRQTGTARRAGTVSDASDTWDGGSHHDDPHAGHHIGHGPSGALDTGHVPALAAPPRRQVVVDLDTEAQALRDLVLTDRLEALLEWVRPGRGVTASGALRRADLAETAALVGATVRTVRDGEVIGRQGEVRPGTLVTSVPMGRLGGEDSVVPVHVMRDVSVLARAWNTLVDVGALDVGATRVHVSDVGLAWLDRDGTDGTDGVAERRNLAVAYLTQVLTVDESRIAAFAGLNGRIAATQLMSLLTHGPMPSVRDDPLGVLLGVVEFNRLAEQGILRMGATVSITPGLEGVVVRAVHAWRQHAGEE